MNKIEKNMAQTISELEKERADVLKAIDMQAQQMSSKHPADKIDDKKEHSLNDWLNAAEEVMPTQPRKRTNTANQKKQSQPVSKLKPNKASFFGVVIMLSLLLTVLGVLYIAYTSIHNELQKVLANNEKTMKQVESMQIAMTDLQKSVASGGQTATFTALQKKVSVLENEINLLKANATDPKGSVIPSSQGLKTPEKESSLNIVQLDRKLQTYTQEINQKLELIMQRLSIKPIESKKVPSVKQKPAELSINMPKEPQIVEPKVKPLNTPVVSLVKKLPEPTAPKISNHPIKHDSAEVKWLMSQPSNHYTMQLASMPERFLLKKIQNSKRYPDAKILPQIRDGKTQYILVTGSYANRKAADADARHYQATYKISPWVRKIKDLKAKIK